MELILERIAKQKTYTIGHLYIQSHNLSTPLPSSPLPSGGAGGGPQGEGAFCDTLEPTWRDYRHGGRKIKGCSAIPEGRYAVVITWSPKFRMWLPLLLGNEDFRREWKGVRIHAGNTAQDTEGCILVGQNLKKGMVLNSRIWLKRLIDKISEAKNRGEAVWLTVKTT